MTKLSVVGLGKLGACFLAVASEKYEVIGVDLDPVTVKKINEGVAPVQEPGLQELLDKNQGRYSASENADKIVGTDITFVVVPTPSQDDGRFSNEFVLQAIAAIAKVIQKKRTYHLIVIVSTVMPGSTLGAITASLRAFTGHMPGQNWDVCYSPEFIALGSVIHDMQNPDMLLIGAQSNRAGNFLQDVLLNIVGEVPVARLTVQEAEIAKLALNCYVTTKISFANNLAELCEEVRGVDARNVMRAIGLDSRVGAKYLQPGGSFGGPCFPRDNVALLRFAADLSVRAPLAEGTLSINDRQVGRVANLIERVTAWGEPIGILGVAYKPNTPVVTRSMGLELAVEMVERGVDVMVYDPVAMDELYAVLGDAVTYATSVEQVLDETATTVVAQPCDEFQGIDAKGRTIIDLWGVVDGDVLRPGVFQWGLP